MKLIAAVVLLAFAPAAVSANTEIRIKRLPSAAYELHGEFTVDASTGAVWDVLTDYEGIPSYVSSMRSSRVLETRADGTLLVEQKAVGGMYFLRRSVTILLEVRRGEGSLQFEDVGREDFWRYEGGWTAEPAASGAHVSYRLIAQPDFAAPSMIMSRVMKRGARELLDQVRAEILRREAAE
jgi:carbon monoxide dehydrogenase subunit G